MKEIALRRFEASRFMCSFPLLFARASARVFLWTEAMSVGGRPSLGTSQKAPTAMEGACEMRDDLARRFAARRCRAEPVLHMGTVLIESKLSCVPWPPSQERFTVHAAKRFGLSHTAMGRQARTAEDCPRAGIHTFNRRQLSLASRLPDEGSKVAQTLLTDSPPLVPSQVPPWSIGRQRFPR